VTVTHGCSECDFETEYAYLLSEHFVLRHCGGPLDDRWGELDGEERVQAEKAAREFREQRQAQIEKAAQEFRRKLGSSRKKA